MSEELVLKYGMNPNQTEARVEPCETERLPFRVLNGQPGYINLLDALNGWQLVSELDAACGLPAATSFKHVSPAGAALGLPLDPILRQVCAVDPDAGLTPLANAYARARGADRMSAFGDFISLSRTCDAETAGLIRREVSDGIIAPGYDPQALDILSAKKNGRYCVLEVDAGYQPPELERKDVFGVRFTQRRNDRQIGDADLDRIVSRSRDLPEEARRDLLLGLITLKYTQSNSVCFVKDGQTIGIGAGQQSRIHCTRIAAEKADHFYLRKHPKTLALPFKPGVARVDHDNAIDLYLSPWSEDVLGDANWQNWFDTRPEPLGATERAAWLAAQDGASYASDAFLPFGDNLRRAAASGVRYVAQTGGSARDEQVLMTGDELGLTMVFTGIRLFHH